MSIFTPIVNFFLGSSIGQINNNFTKVEAELAKKLPRDGSAVVTGNIDMDSHRIINHPYPVDNTDVATFGALKDYTASISAGPPGPSNNTRANLAALKAAATNDLTSLYDGSLWTWTLGDYTGKADDLYVVKANSTALTVGAWVRQSAAKVGFAYGTAHAVAMDVATRLKQTVTVADFGCPGNGTGDLGLALQYIHDEVLGPDGGAIRLPSGRTGGGNYPLATSVSFTKPVELIGEGGATNCEILLTSNIIAIRSTNYLRMERIGITAISGGLDAAALVQQDAPGVNHRGSGASNCRFSGGARGWRAFDAFQLSFDAVEFDNYSVAGISSECATSSDRGDSIVRGCWFAGRAGASGIICRNSGLYISASKWNSAPGLAQDYAVRIIADQGAIGDFTITGCSFEGYTVGAIALIGPSINTKVLITGNQFSSTVANNPYISIGQNAQHVSIIGNTFNDQGTTATAIGYDNTCSELTITGNQFYDIATAISGPASVTANPGIFVGDNRFSETVGVVYAQGENPDLLTAAGSQKRFKLTRLISNTSNSAYVDAWKLLGVCRLKVSVFAIVQGVSRAQYFADYVCNDTATPALVGTATSVGAAFDTQVAVVSGQVHVGIKRNGSTGSSVVAYVQIEVDGYVTSLAKA